MTGNIFDLESRCAEVDAMLNRVEAALTGHKEYGLLDNAADFALFKRFKAECWPLLDHSRQVHYTGRIITLQGKRPSIFI